MFYAEVGTGADEETINATLNNVSMDKTKYLVDNLRANGYKLMAFFLVYLIYAFINAYADEVSMEVASEKNSRLMEMMLLSVEPMALLAGKMCAVLCAALLKVSVWFVAVMLGRKIGMLLCGGQGVDVIENLVEFFKSSEGLSELSVFSVVLAMCAIFAGLLFYMGLAVISGSMISDMDDHNGLYIVWQMPLFISFIVYFIGWITESPQLSFIQRVIPVFSAIALPGDILLGMIPAAQAVLFIFLLLLFGIFNLYIGAKIYKGLVLYVGDGKWSKVIRSIFFSQKDSVSDRIG